MDLALLVYAINTLSGIRGILAALVGLSALIVLGLFLYMGDQYGEDNKNKLWAWKRVKMWFGIGLAAVFLVVILPSQKTAYTMVGAYAAQKIAQDPKVEQMGSKVLTIINQKLDGYIDEGIEKAVEKVKK